MKKLLFAPVSLLAFMLPVAANASDAIVAGAFTVERPTLLSLGFEWRVGDDVNRNASVAVYFRKKGESAWRQGLPMLRMGGERVTGYDAGPSRYGVRAATIYDYTAPNMFSGSILNLEPDTDYECRFVLSDADGVTGPAEQNVTVRTRKTPAPAAGGNVYHVYPFGYKGPVQEPAFYSLMAAYYLGADQSDHSIAYAPRVQPGDTILMHAGVYKDARHNYSGFDMSAAAYGTPFDGTYFLTANGTPEKPIVIKSAGDGEVIFDGDGNANLFNLMSANYNYFDGITVRNTQVGFLLGWKNIAGASGFTLVNSYAEHVGRVVQDEWAGSKDFYIANNVFIGGHDPEKLQTWYRGDVWSKFPGFPAPVTSEYAVKVYGQGHVVAYNYVANWHDGIDFSTYGTPSSDPSKNPSSNDFYNNDLYNMADNCIEADGSSQNMRIFNNRCTNSAVGAISAQPIFGGPLYIYRNLTFGGTTGGPLKFIDTPSGVLVYQNTFIGQGALMRQSSNIQFRNNLFVGDNWNSPIFDFTTFTNYSSSDYNGFRPNPGAKENFVWTAPKATLSAEYNVKALVKKSFDSLPAFSKDTGQDAHSVLVDYTVFQKVSAPDPNDPQRLLNPEDYDFSLVRNSAAVDKGMVLPNITDGFTGSAPDLGAFEYGKPLPHYGPLSWPVGSARATSPRSIAGPPHKAPGH